MTAEELEEWLDNPNSMHTGQAAEDGEPKGKRTNEQVSSWSVLPTCLQRALAPTLSHPGIPARMQAEQCESIMICTLSCGARLLLCKNYLGVLWNKRTHDKFMRHSIHRSFPSMDTNLRVTALLLTPTRSVLVAYVPAAYVWQCDICKPLLHDELILQGGKAAEKSWTS